MAKYIESPDKQQIDVWQKSFGAELIELENEQGNVFYFKPLESCNNFVQIVSRVIAFLRQNDVVQAGQVIVSNTALGGSFDFKENPALSVSLGINLIDELKLPTITKKKRK